ncbi:PCYCGC motif-containing (lipo)protein [Falsibacillus pallidus]|uniref:PCYCGC motif-containing (lipo)protein n=1 Tax=Falsibacillus pallidus TaxID=493781 RepID=UPI003D9697DE
MRKVLFLTLIFPLTLLGACANHEAKNPSQNHAKGEQATGHGDHDAMAAMGQGDIREATSSATILPSFMKNKPKKMQDIYLAVAQNRELLEKIPCYCGCGESVGHMNNYDCYIHENRKDGSVVWDDHGTKCGVCLDIAEKAIQAKQQGMSVKQIRAMIDQQYKTGYAKPTPTPEV